MSMLQCVCLSYCRFEMGLPGVLPLRQQSTPAGVVPIESFFLYCHLSMHLFCDEPPKLRQLLPHFENSAHSFFFSFRYQNGGSAILNCEHTLPLSNLAIGIFPGQCDGLQFRRSDQSLQSAHVGWREWPQEQLVTAIEQKLELLLLMITTRNLFFTKKTF